MSQGLLYHGLSVRGYRWEADDFSDSPWRIRISHEPSTLRCSAYASAFNEYVRRVLKYDNDLPYEVLTGKTRPWNFAGGGGLGNGYLYVGDDLRNAMTMNPHLKLLVCAGRYDLATPYFGVEYTLDHLHLAAPLRKNITMKFFPGGHMIYHVKVNLEALHKDVGAFIKP